MNMDRGVKRWCCALGAALALASTIACAEETIESETSAPRAPMELALDAGAQSSQTTAATPRRIYPPSEAGVRRAAAQGSDALRRYIWRTRMIYNYYYWDFAKRR
ncbi:MAG: hypothetical protein ABI316_05530 [Casimicrobiaceae bacterium]